MPRCPEGICDTAWRNDAKSRDARAKHGTHKFPFAAAVRSVHVDPRRGFDPRGVQYLMRKLSSTAVSR